MNKSEFGSVWTNKIEFPNYPSLQKKMEADAVVIGGGICGLLTAFLLQKEGYEVIVLEANRVASGQTQNTTAKITSQHGLFYDSLIKKQGIEKAKLYADANEAAILQYKELITNENIDCDFETLPAYLYSTQESDVLKKEVNAAKRLGINAEYVTNTVLPFPVKGAVKFNDQASFHPLKFLSHIVKTLTIYENTLVTSIEKNELTTNNGTTIKANHIILTSHYPFINVPGYFFIKMHQERSYVIALKNALICDGLYYSADTENNTKGFSFRNYGDLLFMGGGYHRTGENKAGGKYDGLRREAKKLFPDAQEVAHWSAQDCIPLDNIPYIGQFSNSTPDMYVATGFKKWGMTHSMVAAHIITDLVKRVENPYVSLYNPSRLEFSSSATSLMNETAHAFKNLSKEFLTLPKSKIDELPVHHGGVVMHEGQKVGVYKNEKGEAFIVSTKCTHLGCELTWNPDELTWDCPCHGSRFNYKGELLNNPAIHNIN